MVIQPWVVSLESGGVKPGEEVTAACPSPAYTVRRGVRRANSSSNLASASAAAWTFSSRAAVSTHRTAARAWLALIFPTAPLSRCAARARAVQSWCVRASCNSSRRSGQSARKSSMISRNSSASPATRSQRVLRSRMPCFSSGAAGVSGVEAAGAVKLAMTSKNSAGRSGLVT